MRTVAALAALFGGGVATDTVSTSPLLQFLALLASSGAVAAAATWWRTRKTAPLDHDKIVQEITARAMDMNRTAIERVNALSEELDKLRDQLTATQRQLAEANNRIRMLEERLAVAAHQLHATGKRRETLEQELKAATSDRDHLKARVQELNQRMAEMEAALEGKEPRHT